MADVKEYKELSCKDFRKDCEFTVRAKTEDELMKECREHACNAHGKCNISPATEERIKSKIRDVWS